MHPLNTARRRRLVAASVRLERCLRRENTLPGLIARRRMMKLLTRHNPWPWHAL